MIKVLQATVASVQDLGRQGCRRYGVGCAGAMDELALRVGNFLLGNAASDAAIEISLPPFRVCFLRDTAFALTGHAGQARLDGAPVRHWWLSFARVGQVLDLSGGGGGRSYLCLPGGMDVPEVMGSRSTQLRGAIGGHEGRLLRKDDQLGWRRQDEAGVQDAWRDRAPLGVLPPAQALPPALSAQGKPAMRVIPAAEHDAFTPPSLDAFWRQDWTITPESNRVGYRLAGAAPLVFKQAMEMRSHGIVPGVIQVPPSGQPIIQLADANVSGGYPKIATVIGADLWWLGQAPLGSPLRFVPVTQDEALAARRQLARYLDEAAYGCAAWHAAARSAADAATT